MPSQYPRPNSTNIQLYSFFNCLSSECPEPLFILDIHCPLQYHLVNFNNIRLGDPTMAIITRDTLGRPRRKNYLTKANVGLTPEQHDMLTHLRDTYGISFAESVRQCLDNDLKRLRQRLQKRAQRREAEQKKVALATATVSIPPSNPDGKTDQ